MDTAESCAPGNPAPTSIGATRCRLTIRFFFPLFLEAEGSRAAMIQPAAFRCPIRFPLAEAAMEVASWADAE
jgi:hypothetical protein